MTTSTKQAKKITSAYATDVALLYKMWLTGKSLEELRDMVVLPNGGRATRMTVSRVIHRAFGKDACNRQKQSLRRSLMQDVVRGKLRVPKRNLLEVERWILTAAPEDLGNPRYYSEGELYRDRGRNFEFKESVFQQETEEAKVLQVVSKRGAVWWEGSDLLDIYNLENWRHLRIDLYGNNGLMSIYTFTPKGRVELFPACRLY